MKRWICSACGAEGIVSPGWGEHGPDIIADTHRDQNNECDRANGTSCISITRLDLASAR